MKADEFKDSEVDFKNADEILTENMVSKKFYILQFENRLSSRIN